MKRISVSLLSFAIAITLILLPSCSKSGPWEWERNYYSYQKGAYINGVEHHEKDDWTAVQYIFAGQNYCGFSLEGKNGVIKTYNSMSSLYDVWWSGPDDNNSYTINIWVYADSISFKPGVTYSFKVPDGGYSDWDKPFYNGSGFESLPIVVGYMTKGNNDVYDITDGQITFGAFRITSSGNSKYGFYYGGRNEDRVSFSFTAENSEGKVLIVENGYVNKYTNK